MKVLKTVEEKVLDATGKIKTALSFNAKNSEQFPPPEFIFSIDQIGAPWSAKFSITNEEGSQTYNFIPKSMLQATQKYKKYFSNILRSCNSEIVGSVSVKNARFGYKMILTEREKTIGSILFTSEKFISNNATYKSQIDGWDIEQTKFNYVIKYNDTIICKLSLPTVSHGVIEIYSQEHTETTLMICMAILSVRLSIYRAWMTPG